MIGMELLAELPIATPFTCYSLVKAKTMYVLDAMMM
jgi:hypothetical protein